MVPLVTALTIAGVGFLCVAVLLTCHHKFKHSRQDDNLLPPDDQWFQQKDVCVAKCTHENWVLAFLGLGMFTLWAAAIFAISGFELR